MWKKPSNWKYFDRFCNYHMNHNFSRSCKLHFNFTGENTYFYWALFHIVICKTVQPSCWVPEMVSGPLEIPLLYVCIIVINHERREISISIQKHSMKKTVLKPTRSWEVLSRYNAYDFSFLLSLCANVRHYINFNPPSCFLFLCHNEKQLWASQECKSNFQRISGQEIPYITKGHTKIT